MHRKALFLPLSCLIVLIIYDSLHSVKAQQRILDSMAHVISIEKSDTQRIKMTNWRNEILRNTHLDSAIYYGIKNMAAAHEIDYYEGELITRQQLAINYFYKGNFEAARQQLESNSNFIKITEDSLEVSILYSNYGMMYGMQSIYDTSIQYYEKSIAIGERHDLSNLGSNYSNIAIGYQQTGNFPMALRYQQKGLKHSEEKKNEISRAYLLLNMAATYNMMGDAANAEKIYLQALASAKKNNQKNIEIYCYSNLASLYTSERRWDKAYEAAMNSLSVAGPNAEQGIRSAGYSKAAWALAYLGKYEAAVPLAKKAISLADSSRQPINISQAYNAMGTNFFLQKKYIQAIPYFEKGKKSVKELNLYSTPLAQIYKQLSFAYENTGNYVKALENFKLAASIQDSITKKENIRKTTELTMNLEFQKKQEVISAERRKEEQLASTKQYALLGGLVFVLLLGIIAFIAYRTKQRANKTLAGQKQQIESTLTKLKSTQSQLIQSEKMASLGELTAGIAHEIQNPLNFVNNFSEINQELLREMRGEIDQGNIDEAKEIVTDVIANEEKINHHGKRADSIVKGMLLHSRTSTGQKELTNINALCDEYLRLSYHGIRAKDKNFNATMKTDFDSAIGKLNVIPQDVGRVLLNIFNNAFFAVSEKKSKSGDEYLPTLNVSTKNADEKIEIRVTDNGTGIPQKVVDKIFQPFFTTKPTGQGTGLGLSLSYDIVKAHGGELKVNSEEGKFTEFVIQLPIN